MLLFYMLRIPEVIMKKLIVSVLMFITAAATSFAGDISDAWSTIAAPPAPRLFDVEASSDDTALLILDSDDDKSSANQASVSRLISRAQDAGIPVLFSAANGNILSGSATVLDGELKKRHIKNIIITGMARQGAVLNTASAASYMGYRVIAPVDVLEDEATLWNLADGSTATLTKSARIKFVKG